MPRGRVPSRVPTEAETLAIQEGRSNYYLLKEFGVAAPIVERWRHDLEHVGEPQPEFAPPNSIPENGDRASWRELIRTTQAHTEAKQGVDTDVTSMAVNLGDKPTGLFLASDWHVGSDAVNLDHILRDAEYVGEFRRAFPGALNLCHLGDPIDGYMPGLGGASGGMFEASEVRLDRQEGMFMELAKTMAGLEDEETASDNPNRRWLLQLLGCHEAWTLSKGGRDAITPMAKDLGAVNGGYGVVLVAQVGEQQYRGVLRHRVQRESKQNTTNAQRAVDDDTGLDPFGHRADFISVSHLHNNDLQERVKSGRPVIYTRSGAYKGGDCFARSINATMHKHADEGAPVLVLYPDHKEIVPFSGRHWRHGLDFLARAHAKG